MRIVFFDGHCNLCNGTVDWIIRHDKDKIFYFSSLQGKKIKEINLPEVFEKQDSIIYFRYGVYFSKSQAVVHIMEDLGGLWGILASLVSLVPKRIADFGYDVIARYRYKVWGKKDTCRVPTPSEREHFLD